MSAPLQLLPFFPATFFNTDGSLLAGGQLYSYEAGTSTPQATYTDSTGVTPNANPTILNSVGQASIFLGAGLGYKFVLFDVDGNQLSSADNIYSIPPGSISNSELAEMAADTIKGNNGGSSAEPSDLTGDEVTAMLIPFVGDSGSGGTQGLVPAPPAGSTAGGYSLSPDGSWVPDDNKIEVVFKSNGDFCGDGKMVGWPQFPWSAPNLLAQPSVLPTTDVQEVAWSPGMEYLACAVGGLTGPQLLIYQRVLNNFLALPAPNVYAQPGVGATGISWSSDGEYLAVSFLSASPGFYIYKRKGSIFTSLPAPAVAPGGGAEGIAFSPTGEFLAVAAFGSTPLFIYQRQTNQSLLQGFPGGTVNGKLATTPPLGVTTIGNTYSDNAINSAFAANVKPTLDKNLSEVQSVINQNLFETTFACINNLYSFTVTALASLAQVNATFTNNGQTFTVVQEAQAFATTLICSGTGAPAASGNLTWASGVAPTGTTAFSSATQTTNPSAQPAGNALRVAWSPDGQFLAVTTDTAPYLFVYQKSGATFTAINLNTQYAFVVTALTFQTDVGATYTNNGETFTVSVPAAVGATVLLCSGTGAPSASGTLTRSTGTGQNSISFSVVVAQPADQANCVSFSPDSQFMAVGINASPYLLLFQISGSTFTAIVSYGSLPTGNVLGVGWSPNGLLLAIGLDASPYMMVYSRSGSTFTSLANPTTLPAGGVNAVAFSPNCQMLAAASVASPYINVYETGSDMPTNALLYASSIPDV